MSNITTDISQECPRCGSENLIEQVGDDEPTCHYGRLKCGDCGRHIQWLRDPATTDAVAKRKSIIEELINTDELTDVEEEFLERISEARWISEKQEAWFERIHIRVFGSMLPPFTPNSKPRQRTG